jgi:hypothetical protein
VACRYEALKSCSRKLALICGLLLLAVAQAWSAGHPVLRRSSRPASTVLRSFIRNRWMVRQWFSFTVP